MMMVIMHMIDRNKIELSAPFVLDRASSVPNDAHGDTHFFLMKRFIPWLRSNLMVKEYGSEVISLIFVCFQLNETRNAKKYKN